MIEAQHATGVEAGWQPASQSLYRCCLDEQPDHLVPRHALQAWLSQGSPNGEVTLNPSCRRIPLRATIPQFHESLFNSEGLSRLGQGLRVDQPGSNIGLAFWIGPEFDRIVEALCAGSEQPSHLSDRVRTTLVVAGVLTSQNDFEYLRRAWARKVERCSEMFRKDGYCPVSGLIHPFHISALRSHYRRRIRMGELRLGDSQTSRRYVAYNDPVASFFHRDLAPVISAISGTAVRPSYCYLVSYQQGSVLEKHVDRKQCEISLTFCLDYSPEPQRETPWPIYVHPDRRRIAVYQALGDGLLYRGCALPHSREQIPDGHTSTSLLFHYVPADFQGSLD